jgi:hypothetical protein
MGYIQSYSPCTGRSSVAARRGGPGGRGRAGTVRRNGRASWCVVIVRDSELCSVLVLAVGVADELYAVAGLAWFEMLAGSPDVAPAVIDSLDNWVQRLSVSLWTLEKNESHGAFGRRLPCNGVRLANRDNVMQTRCPDGVALWRRTHWLCVGTGQRH